jgi:hypothetical protein
VPYWKDTSNRRTMRINWRSQNSSDYYAKLRQEEALDRLSDIHNKEEESRNKAYEQMQAIEEIRRRLQELDDTSRKRKVRLGRYYQ